jgi:hypothetical protein
MRWLLFASLVLVTVAFSANASADEPAPPQSVSLAMEVLFGRSFASITCTPELVQRGIPELRHPQWTGPDPPKPPALHVRFLRITF